MALDDNETGRDGEESSMGSEVPSMAPKTKRRSRDRGDFVVHTTSLRPGQNIDQLRDLNGRGLPRNGCKIVRLRAQRWPITQGVPSTNVL